MSATPAREWIDLIVQLSLREGRKQAAETLARRLGAETLLIFVQDPEIGSLIPAPGFPQTLSGGRAWRSFLASCQMSGHTEAEVDLPPGSQRPAIAVGVSGMVLILIGGRPDLRALSGVERLLPLLATTLMAEQEAIIAAGEAKVAQDAARRGLTLAKALEAARSEASKLNAELSEEHRRKDDFLAMLAHELRNPLAPLVSSIELLRRRRFDPHTLAQQLDVMGRQAAQLARLIEDLLDVSRVSHGRVELRRQRLSLGDVLTDSLEVAGTLLQARRHQVSFTLPEEPLVVFADPVRLTQVFSNLLHNAAKYTDPGGQLTITVQRKGEYAEVAVRDSGIGIPTELLSRIFDLFIQAPVSLDRAQGGLGIGLTMVRSLVELHDGSVTAESAGSGQGSTFTVRLPLATPEAAWVPPEVSPPELPAESLRVLVVDDNEDAVDALAEILRLMDHHVDVAYSGLAALQMVGDLHPDLVLLDIGLPDINGHEVVRRMARMTTGPTHFVALTGYGSDEDKQRSREAGFDEHLVKPLKIEVLEELLTRVEGQRPR